MKNQRIRHRSLRAPGSPLPRWCHFPGLSLGDELDLCEHIKLRYVYIQLYISTYHLSHISIHIHTYHRVLQYMIQYRYHVCHTHTFIFILYTWTHWIHYTSAAASTDLLPSANLLMKPVTKMAKDRKLNHISWCGEMPRYDLISFQCFSRFIYKDMSIYIRNETHPISIYTRHVVCSLKIYMIDKWQLQWISDTSYSSVEYDISLVLCTDLRTYVRNSDLCTNICIPNSSGQSKRERCSGQSGPNW